MSEFSELPSKTQRMLAVMSDAVQGVLPEDVRSWRFSSGALPISPENLNLPAEVSNWVNRSKSCLYFFRCTPGDVDLARIRTDFLGAKSCTENVRCYPRLNQNSSTLYVGSSQSMANRLREHLGYGARGTYALQLVHWARDADVELDFVCAKYPKDTSPEVLQTLEDTLWQELAPMFGRQGRK